MPQGEHVVANGLPSMFGLGPRMGCAPREGIIFLLLFFPVKHSLCGQFHDILYTFSRLVVNLHGEIFFSSCTEAEELGLAYVSLFVVIFFLL